MLIQLVNTKCDGWSNAAVNKQVQNKSPVFLLLGKVQSSSFSFEMFNSQNSHLELTAGINLELNKYTFWALQCGVVSISVYD